MRRKKHITASSGIEDRKGGDGEDRNWRRWQERGRKGIKKKENWMEGENGNGKEAKNERWIKKMERRRED